MQVNNNYSPNFGMALRIHPRAKGKLQQRTMEYLQGLAQIGEECKTHKYVDLDLTESLMPVVNRRDCANAYTAPFKPIKVSGDAVEVEARWAGTTATGVQPGENYSVYLEFANADEARKAYESMVKANEKCDALESAFNFAKLQEQSIWHKVKVQQEAAARQAKINAEVDKLMSAFPNVDA